MIFDPVVICLELIVLVKNTVPFNRSTLPSLISVCFVVCWKQELQAIVNFNLYLSTSRKVSLSTLYAFIPDQPPEKTR